MTEMTVFNWDSNNNTLKQKLEEVKKLKVDEGILTNLLSLVGRASVSEEAVTAHNKLIDETIKSYTIQMNKLLTLTEQMKKDNVKNNFNNNVRMEKMSDYITKLKLSLDIQEKSIQRSQATINNHNLTIERLKKDNTSIQEAKDALTTQNEKQNTTNQKLTTQNAEQQQQISGMEKNLSELRNRLYTQSVMITQQTAKFRKITDSNRTLKEKLEELKATQAETEKKAQIAAAEFEEIKKAQDAHIKDINAAQKIRVAFLRNSAKNKLKKQQEEFQKSIAEIKQESDKSIEEKEAQIKQMTKAHTNAQNELNTQLNNIQATNNATIDDLKTELSIFKTEEQLGKEDQEKQKKMLRTETRILPLGWKNSKGFNIGNITTQVRGEKPYNATDTIDHYLYTLFHGKIPGQERLSVSSRHVPIIQEKRSGGKNNRLGKSKKSKKSKNNKTKKQRKY